MSDKTKEKIDALLADIDKASTAMDASLCLHRFLCHNDWCPRSAYERVLRDHGHIVVWAAEAAKATNLGPARLWKIFSPTHEAGLVRAGWTLSLNRKIDPDKDVVWPSPGSLKDGSVIYGMPPWPKPTTAIVAVNPPPPAPPIKAAKQEPKTEEPKKELAAVVSALHQAGVNGNTVDALLGEALIQWQDGKQLSEKLPN